MNDEAKLFDMFEVGRQEVALTIINYRKYPFAQKWSPYGKYVVFKLK